MCLLRGCCAGAGKSPLQGGTGGVQFEIAAGEGGGLDLDDPRIIGDGTERDPTRSRVAIGSRASGSARVSARAVRSRSRVSASVLAEVTRGGAGASALAQRMRVPARACCWWRARRAWTTQSIAMTSASPPVSIARLATWAPLTLTAPKKRPSRLERCHQRAQRVRAGMRIEAVDDAGAAAEIVEGARREFVPHE